MCSTILAEKRASRSCLQRGWRCGTRGPRLRLPFVGPEPCGSGLHAGQRRETIREIGQLHEVMRPRISRGVVALGRRCSRRAAGGPASARPPRTPASSPSCAAPGRPSPASSSRCPAATGSSLLRNETGKQVIVKGYEDEPYLRFLPNQVVEENTRSPSKYANEDRYALTPLPPQANSEAAPKWRAGLAGRLLQVVRPPHPLDGEGTPAAGEGRGRAHQDLRLARADDGRRARRSPRSARSSGCPRIRRAPRPA